MVDPPAPDPDRPDPEPADQYPIVAFGARWVCDGPKGRFHARTKAEAVRLLREAGGSYDDHGDPDAGARTPPSR